MENVYLLKLGEDPNLIKTVLQRLCLKDAPYYVRVATLAPISNFGYPESAEGALLALTPEGITFGVQSDPHIPRSFIPWQNVAYVADGDMMKDYSDFRAEYPDASWEEFLASQEAS